MRRDILIIAVKAWCIRVVELSRSRKTRRNGMEFTRLGPPLRKPLYGCPNRQRLPLDLTEPTWYPGYHLPTECNKQLSTQLKTCSNEVLLSHLLFRNSRALLIVVDLSVLQKFRSLNPYRDRTDFNGWRTCWTVVCFGSYKSFELVLSIIQTVLTGRLREQDNDELRLGDNHSGCYPIVRGYYFFLLGLTKYQTGVDIRSVRGWI